MKKILLLISLVVVVNADNGTITPQKFFSQFKRVENEINEVLSNSRKTRDISRKFKKIAEEHRDLFVGYINQKSECANLEDIFQYQKSYSAKSFNLKKFKLDQCYENLRRINLNYRIINQDFLNLEEEIQVMMDMVEVDLAKIPSLEKQLDTIQYMLEFDKSRIKSKQESLQYIEY